MSSHSIALPCYRVSENLIAELPILRVCKGQALINSGQQCCLCLAPYQVRLLHRTQNLRLGLAQSALIQGDSLRKRSAVFELVQHIVEQKRFDFIAIRKIRQAVCLDMDTIMNTICCDSEF